MFSYLFKRAYDKRMLTYAIFAYALYTYFTVGNENTHYTYDRNLTCGTASLHDAGW